MSGFDALVARMRRQMTDMGYGMEPVGVRGGEQFREECVWCGREMRPGAEPTRPNACRDCGPPEE